MSAKRDISFCCATFYCGLSTGVANGSGTAKAMDYSLRRWAALSRYASDGRLPIDNNPVENIIRPIALGRNNVKSVFMRSRLQFVSPQPI